MCLDERGVCCTTQSLPIHLRLPPETTRRSVRALADFAAAARSQIKGFPFEEVTSGSIESITMVEAKSRGLKRYRVLKAQNVAATRQAPFSTRCTALCHAHSATPVCSCCSHPAV